MAKRRRSPDPDPDSVHREMLEHLDRNPPPRRAPAPAPEPVPEPAARPRLMLRKLRLVTALHRLETDRAGIQALLSLRTRQDTGETTAGAEESWEEEIGADDDVLGLADYETLDKGNLDQAERELDFDEPQNADAALEDFDHKLTESAPKCAVDLHGRSLLDWQIDHLLANGVDEVVVVAGMGGEVHLLPLPRAELHRRAGRFAP